MDREVEIYESLLAEESELEQKCERYYTDYLKEFGSELENVFEAKLEAITIKRKIAYLLQRRFLGKEPTLAELNAYVDEEIKSFRTQLDQLKSDKSIAEKTKWIQIEFEEKHQIKKLYYAICHLIHPDLHPELAKDARYKSYWQEAQDAYRKWNREGLEKVYDKIRILQKGEEPDFRIPNIQTKIAALKRTNDETKRNPPYTYGELLNDANKIEEYHQNLKKQLSGYKTYVKSLQKQLNDLILDKRREQADGRKNRQSQRESARQTLR